MRGRARNLKHDVEYYYFDVSEYFIKEIHKDISTYNIIVEYLSVQNFILNLKN